MKELTDNEIIVALNKAWGLNGISIYCADDRGEYIASVEVISVVNLINRLQSQKEALIAGQETLQKALAEKDKEIERLNDALINKCIYLSDDETTEYCVDGPCPKFKTDAQIKAEAIKEFAERLKTEAKLRNHTNYGANKQAVSYNEGVIETRKFMLVCIDNLVKEMMGDTE